MNIWIRHIRAHDPAVRLGIYADDRSIWAQGEDSENIVADAAQAAYLYDHGAGWAWNQGK